MSHTDPPDVRMNLHNERVSTQLHYTEGEQLQRRGINKDLRVFVSTMLLFKAVVHTHIGFTTSFDFRILNYTQQLDMDHHEV